MDHFLIFEQKSLLYAFGIWKSCVNILLNLFFCLYILTNFKFLLDITLQKRGSFQHCSFIF